jgi:hypothetical protein
MPRFARLKHKATWHLLTPDGETRCHNVQGWQMDDKRWVIITEKELPDQPILCYPCLKVRANKAHYEQSYQDWRRSQPPLAVFLHDTPHAGQPLTQMQLATLLDYGVAYEDAATLTQFQAQRRINAIQERLEVA